MATVFIIHGAYGHPGENWFPWLKERLEELGHEVVVPAFPTPEGQTLEKWLKVFSTYQQQVTAESVFIGHSIGPAFILTVLEQLESPVKAGFFVGGFFGETEHFASCRWSEIQDGRSPSRVASRPFIKISGTVGSQKGLGCAH